ncbi:MAG: alpha/beta hydrolase, partial [Proteiniphilum sp.]|nr:alpha/beta hydrolase [Proteiniphilum sp.]
MIHKRLSIIIAVVLLSLSLLAGLPNKQTFVYAEKEGEELKLDLYRTDSATLLPQPCLVFVFGGGFKDGERDAELYKSYFTHFANRGFTVVSIDY